MNRVATETVIRRLLINICLAAAAVHGSAQASDPVTRSVTAGGEFTCGIHSDGRVGCWGHNHKGQSSPPNGTFIAIGAGTAHACGVRSDGTLTCWGFSGNGETNSPAGTFSAVSAGVSHSCGMRSDGMPICWGDNSSGQASPPAGTFTAVSAGFFHTCGVRSDGTLACWGDNGFYRASPPTGTFKAVSAGAGQTCGVRSDDTLACWGDNFHGQASPPTGTFKAVSAGGNHTCGLRSDDTLACWGDNSNGVSNPPAGTFTAVSAGWLHTCGVRSDDTLACWGSDFRGQAPEIALLPVMLPEGNFNAPYSQALALEDTAATRNSSYPYTPPTPGFALISGALPPGLTLSAAGAIVGTPTDDGSSSFTVAGEDANGFAAQRDYMLTIQPPLDSTPPVIVPTVAGTLGDNGWYTSIATVSWSVSDAESAISSTAGCSTATLNFDTLGADFTCTATSAGGTSSQSVTLKRDATAPLLAPAVLPTVILLNGSGSVAANASDALSGVATQGCSALDTSTVGIHTSTCTATDAAGNTATATVSYSVIYGFVGFAPPVENAPVLNLANGGRTIPFKWRLVDANGTPVTNLSGVTVRAVSMSCDSTAAADAVEEYVSASTGFLNHGNGDYQYNWQSPKSYENTCKKVVIDLGDGSTRVALFRFH